MSSSVVLVNQLDQEQGFADLAAAHRGQGQLHRAVSVFLFRPSTLTAAHEENQTHRFQLLLQQRAAKKMTAPLTWANTVCGHVQPGETYQTCARRRLREELGLEAVMDLEPLTKIIYQVDLADGYLEKEMDQIFVGHWSGQKMKLNPHEVKQTRWVDWQDLMTELGQNDRNGLKLSPWFQYFLEEPTVIDQIKQFLTV